MTVRFSVVIPTRDRREIVLRTLRALSEQEFRDFEVVVVDDGSGDGTANAVRSLAPGFVLKVLEQGENNGAAAARNAGAASAAGQILLFLDDDMEPTPRMLLEHDRSQRAGADLVLGDIPLHPDSPDNVLSRGVGTWARSRAARLAAEAEVPLADLLTGQMSISRAVFERIGGFDTRITRGGLFGGEDLDFGYRARQAGCKVIFNPAAVAYQYYDVDPALFLRRSYQAGLAHQQLAFKHPERAAELGATLDFHSRRSRWLFAPLIAAPAAVSSPLRAGVSALVRRGHDGPRLRRAFLMVRTMEQLRGRRQARRSLGTGSLVVLAYHAIADLRGDHVLEKYGVAPALFAAQLDALLAHGCTFVDLEHLLDALAGRRRLSRRSLLVTFDDCYVDLLDAGVPRLAERGIPAVAFAVAGRVGTSNEWDRPEGARTLRLLDAAGLKTLLTQRVEVGSHGMCHRALTELTSDQLEAELSDSASQLQRLGLPRPRALAYPYGEFSASVLAVARRAGYAAGFTVEAGVVYRHSERLALPRVEVLASDTPRRLRLKVVSAGWPPGVRRRVLSALRTES